MVHELKLDSLWFVFYSFFPALAVSMAEGEGSGCSVQRAA